MRKLGPWDGALLGLMLWTLIHATEACAGDRPPVWGPAANPEFKDLRETSALSTWSVPVPTSFRPLDLRGPAVPATQDFGARPHAAPPANGSDANSEYTVRDTTVWQRLEQFRARNRVQLVTLWETGGNSLSLQAGRKGEPALQWTSRLSHHGGAPSGVLDELFSTSVGGVSGAVGRSLRSSAARSSSPDPGTKPGKSIDAGLAAVGGGPTR